MTHNFTNYFEILPKAAVKIMLLVIKVATNLKVDMTDFIDETVVDTTTATLH